ncbi:hypothetical protein [Flavobacterium sp. ZS1P14]|uniref:hypothetical protein n=1 Tax=Flavobacterium sp. ZS1P14 TaxID=3401729 RepID=UPI003AAD04F2
MELDDLKKSWEAVNPKEKIDAKMIDQITQDKYTSNFKKIVYPEIIGILICFLGAIYIGLNIQELDTNLLKGTGILAIVLLVVIPIISLVSILQFKSVGDVNKQYAETLKDFAVQKIQFHHLQKINVTLSYLLLVTIIILFSKLFGKNDITESKMFWVFSFTLGYVFLLFYSKWVGKYYKNTLQQSEDLLKELES